MFQSIVSYGLAVGAVYALIGITYNVMFSASRVFSFTAGMLGMLGGVLGALFIAKMGMPAIVGFVLVLACGAVLGLVTEMLTVRLPMTEAPFRRLLATRRSLRIGSVALLACLDETGHGDAVGGGAQYGMLDEAGLDRGDGEPRGQRGAAEGKRERGPRAHDDGECRGGDRQRRRDPPHGLALGAEVDRDAGAEGDRQPRHQPTRCELRCCPGGQLLDEGTGEPGLRQTPRRGTGNARPSAGHCRFWKGDV